MARKKSEDNLVEGLAMSDLVDTLMKGTNFEKSEGSNVLSQRIKVHTPLIALDCILGGGTPLGCIVESFGFPKSGKSTWLYQTMGEFLNEYPNGLAIVLDNESSADEERLRYFGVDTARVLRLPSTSIETGFLNLLQILENKGKSEQARQMPIFVVWDSISKGLAQDGATQSRMNAQDRARVIKNYMSSILPQIEKHPFVLNLINQVVFETDRYGNRKVKSGGGVGLEHDVHLKVKTELGSDEYNGSLLVGRYSYMSIVKSKFSPEFNSIPIFIDVTQGGRIDEIRSFVDYLVSLGLIPNMSGYYKIEDTLVPKYKHSLYYAESIRPIWKSLRYSKLIEIAREDSHLIDFLKIVLMEYIGDVYHLQRKVMEDYLNDTRSKYMNESSRYECKLIVSEDYSDLIDRVVADPELLGKLESHSVSDDSRPICTKCGQVLDYHEECPSCKEDWTISKNTLVEVVVGLLPPKKIDTEEDTPQEFSEEVTE